MLYFTLFYFIIILQIRNGYCRGLHDIKAENGGGDSLLIVSPTDYLVCLLVSLDSTAIVLFPAGHTDILNMGCRLKFNYHVNMLISNHCESKMVSRQFSPQQRVFMVETQWGGISVRLRYHHSPGISQNLNRGRSVRLRNVSRLFVLCVSPYNLMGNPRQSARWNYVHLQSVSFHRFIGWYPSWYHVTGKSYFNITFHGTGSFHITIFKSQLQ